MKIAVLGTGTVGTALAGGLSAAGHDVKVGSRTAGEGKVTFAEAAEFGELAFNCTAGAGALDAVGSAAAELEGKVLVDVSNPLEFHDDGPPTLFVANDDSLGERIQRALPGARVVKALNTMNADVMVNPSLVPGDHVAFVCGDDDAAKTTVTGLLGELGWPAGRVIDLGGISAARGTEAYLLIWLRLMGAMGGAHFNIAVQR
jgi:predicted dinucleotide-binding enzyme